MTTKFSEFAEGQTEGLFEVTLKPALVASLNEFHDSADCQARVFGKFDRVLHLEPFGESLRSRFQRDFKKTFGMSLGEFRKLRRQQSEEGQEK